MEGLGHLRVVVDPEALRERLILLLFLGFGGVDHEELRLGVVGGELALALLVAKDHVHAARQVRVGLASRLGHGEAQLRGALERLRQIGLRSDRDHVVLSVHVEELEGALGQVAEGGASALDELVEASVELDPLRVALEADFGRGGGRGLIEFPPMEPLCLRWILSLLWSR